MTKWAAAIMTAVALGTAGSSVQAQQLGGLSGADVALYAGGAGTSPWLEAVNGTTFRVGWNPVLGMIGNVWLRPRLGVRLHGAYMPSRVPQPSTPPAFPVAGQYNERVRNWIFDVSVAARPFGRAGGEAGFSSLYLFFGGGAFTPNVAGGAGQECVFWYVDGGACLPYDWRDAMSAQLTGGLGISALPLGRNLALFFEAGGHAHSSPFRFDTEWTQLPECPGQTCRPEARRAITTRLVGGVKMTLGASPQLARRPLPPPLPPMPDEPVEERPIRVCVVADGVPQYVDGFVQVGQRTDTVVVTPLGLRRPLRAAYPVPPATATGRDWFVRNEPIYHAGREFARVGAPREVPAAQLTRLGDYVGVPLFTDVGAPSPPQRLHVPVQDGCLWQTYQMRGRR